MAGIGIAVLVGLCIYFVLPTYLVFSKSRPFQKQHQIALIVAYLVTVLLITATIVLIEFFDYPYTDLIQFIHISGVISAFVPIIITVVYFLQKNR